MQILVLLMMMLLLADSMQPARLGAHGWGMAALLIGPYVLLAAAAWLSAWWGLRRMDRKPHRTSQTLARLDWFTMGHRTVLLLVFAAQVQLLGGVTWIARRIGDPILVPQLLALALPLTTVCLSWWAYYPIDRRLREAALMRQLDTGEPVAIWSAGQFVLAQFRHHVLLVLAPLLVLLTWEQFVWRRDWSEGTQALATMAGAATVFLLAPLMIRAIWDTVPLPPGELRTRLMDMCRAHRVRLRELLLWRTYGGLINGAVMGLIGPVRYVLLTDGLLERMNGDHVEAVMAHEIGHIRKHHMVALLICGAAAIGTASLIGDEGYRLAEHLLGHRLATLPAPWPFIIDNGMWFAGVAVCIFVFGWVSRRFERQADTFAVQHLSRRYPDTELGAGVVGAPAVRIFADALLRVANLNHIPPERRSWRHGSIRYRLDYLRSLIGTPLDQCRIDRQVRRLVLAAALLLATLLAMGSLGL